MAKGTSSKEQKEHKGRAAAGTLLGLSASERFSKSLAGRAMRNFEFESPGAGDTRRELMHRFAPKGVREVSSSEAARDMTERIEKMFRLGKKLSPQDKKDMADAIAANVEKTLNQAGPAYNPAGRMIINTERVRPEILAHELGHAQAHKRLGKAFIPMSAGSSIGSKLSPVVLGLGAYKYFANKNEDPEKAKKWRNATMVAGTLPPAVVLGNEFDASRRANKMLKEIGAKKPGQAKNLARAFGTYGARLGVPVAIAGGVYGADALVNRRKEQQEKRAQALLKLVLKAGV